MTAEESTRPGAVRRGDARAFAWLVGVAVVIALIAMLAVHHSWSAGALGRFYSQGTSGGNGVAEDMLMDPLIVAGEAVVPDVLRELPNPAMPRRRYAIGFLGNGGYGQALPALRALLVNEGESELIRGDALRAIGQIDASEAQALARKHAARDDFLGTTAKQVLAGETRERRTYLQALLGRHE